MDHDWFDDGAVQILLPVGLLGEWHGIDSSDYERACAASDNWLGQVPVGDGVGLVLGGDPSMVLVHRDAVDNVVLVRWVFADDEHELVSFALGHGPITQIEPDLVLDNSSEQWRLINAAADPCMHNQPSRQVALPLGRIRVHTVYMESENNAAIVHRISRLAFHEAAEVKP